MAALDDLKYWVAFNQVPGIGRAKYALLQERFGDLGEAWRASASELRAAGLDLDRDRARAGVDAVLEQFFERRGRPIDDFTGGDLVDQQIGQNVYGRHTRLYRRPRQTVCHDGGMGSGRREAHA